ncbi:MAG: adenylate kinase [Halobacteriota archaeon]
MVLIIVTGMPGAGSSTVVEEALKLKGGEESIVFKYMNYGDVMYETAMETGLVANRDEMRTLPGEKQREIQMRACKKISKISKSTNLIIDTHCTVKMPLGYLPGLPEHVLRELKPDQFVLIEATTEEIAARRQKDKTRGRDVEDKTSIEEHQFMNRVMSMAYACLTGASVKLIGNHDGGLDKAAEEFFVLMNRLSKSEPEH